MAEIIPITCSSDELAAAISARSQIIGGSCRVRITFDGETTDFTLVTLSELNRTIAGMQMYLDSVAESATVAFVITGCKGF